MKDKEIEYECIKCHNVFECDTKDHPVLFCPQSQGGCGKAWKLTAFRVYVEDKGGKHNSGNGTKMRLTDKLAATPREWLSRKVMKEMHTITLYENSNMFYYADGVYLFDPKGNHHKELIKKYLRNLFNNKELNEIFQILKLESFKNMDIFDKGNPFEICMKNGIYNVMENTFSKHTPDKHFLWKIPTAYNPKANSDHFQKFLSEIVHDRDIPLIQEMMGYLLYRSNKFKKAFMFIGEGDNGKSVLMDFIIAIIGAKNTSSVALHKLESNTFACSRLFGKVANIVDEVSKTGLKKLDNFKKLVAGSLIDAEKKGKDGFDFYNTAKLIFATNNPPIMYDQSDGNFTRWAFITFPNQFTTKLGNRDPNLKDKLVNDSELSGGLNFALEGLKRLLQNETFSNSHSTDSMRDYYVQMSDPLGAFIQEHIENSGDYEDYIPKDAFYDMFKTYCHDNHLVSLSISGVGRRMKELLPNVGQRNASILGKRIPSWKGITSEDFSIDSYFEALRGDQETIEESIPDSVYEEEY